jgi:beta-galactosidase
MKLLHRVTPSLFTALIALALTAHAVSAQAYTPPASPRAVYNFNPGWKFAFGDAPGADQPGFDDSSWSNVSLPHTWNETDTYRAFIRHSSGDVGEKMLGIGWYRKHFKLPAGADGQKVFLQFDGMRQAGHFFLNGQPVGKYENGVSAVGLDVTKFVHFGGQDNILAVQVDNSPGYKEEATGTAFEWNAKDFNPNFGGLNRDAWLVVASPIYQTLPLYENLKTTGIYIYPQNLDVKKQTTDVNIEAEVKNETNDYASISLSAVVVDAAGNVCAKFDGSTSDLVGGQSEVFTATGALTGARFWDVNSPYLYDVYTILTVNGKVVDVCQTRTGFRKTEFKGGAGTGGVWLNDRFVWLTGYAQRAANDWPGLGGAYPDWMHDYNAALLRSSNGNYLRWMHVSPQRADVAACDKYGIVEVCPAGDKERDVTGRQWDQRVEVMRDAMIFYRNNPSIFFWEAGNTIVTPEQMVQMVELRKQWDPNGGRVMGTRDNDAADANNALTPVSEFYGVMIGQDTRTDSMTQPGQIFRGYSVDRRDKAPLIETEDFRDESARGVWDDFSPPTFGFHPKNLGVANTGDSYHWNSETFCLAATCRYVGYVQNRIDNHDPAHAKWSGYASIYWSDSDADGRQDGSEVLRVSGKVDGVRLPKQLYYVSRVMQNHQADLHIIGHWTYPEKTKKTMYVAATLCDSVELFVNGKSQGVQKTPCYFVDPFNNNNVGYTGYIYAFPDIQFAPGNVTAVAYKNGSPILRDRIQTAGAPVALKLTPHTGPHGLQADGSDVVLVDVAAVDAQGNLCPTDQARVDFAVQGPAVWRGGFNSDQLNTTNNLYLDTECGINRVSIRSTLTPGAITLTAKRDGLAPATLTLQSQAMPIIDGLDAQPPQVFSGALGAPVPNLLPESPTLESLAAPAN